MRVAKKYKLDDGRVVTAKEISEDTGYKVESIWSTIGERGAMYFYNTPLRKPFKVKCPDGIYRTRGQISEHYGIKQSLVDSRIKRYQKGKITASEIFDKNSCETKFEPCPYWKNKKGGDMQCLECELSRCILDRKS